MTAPSHQPAHSARDKWTDLSLVLNMNPDPMLIVNQEARVVQLTNKAFLALTHYDLNDVIDHPLSDVTNEAEAADEWVLTSKNGESMRGKWQEQLLLDDELVALHWEPLREDSATVITDAESLLRVAASECFEDACAEVIEAVRADRAVDFCAVYLPDSVENGLIKAYAGEAEPLLPVEIPMTEIARFVSGGLWCANQDAPGALQECAHDADLKSLFVAPIAGDSEISGLLVAGSSDEIPGAAAANKIAMLGRLLFSILRRNVTSTNRNRELQGMSEELLVRNFQIENISQGLILVSPDMKVLEMNSAAELMLGYSLTEVTGMPVESVLIGAEGLTAALRSAAGGVGLHDIGHVSIHRRDGGTMPSKIQVLPIVKAGVLFAIGIILDDISEMQQSQTRAQHLEQRAVIGELSAVFAHEVRNPVNNISTGLQLLEIKLGKDDPNMDNISRMQADCQRINHLMESVLAFSRPIETSKQDIDLPFLLQRILDRWHPRMKKVNVEPYFHADPELPVIKGDNRALERVFINLVGNAVEAMKDTGGLLSVKINLTNEIAGQPHVQVAVSDTGPGIPDGIKEDIFKPFVTTTTDGTGLGLAITYRIVSTHKGTMKFKTFPGGTVFSVFLPVKSGDD